MTEGFEQLRNAVGQLAELCAMFYQGNLDNGFDEVSALTLTKQLMIIVMKGAK